jgi:hypothetical protein
MGSNGQQWAIPAAMGSNGQQWAIPAAMGSNGQQWAIPAAMGSNGQSQQQWAAAMDSNGQSQQQWAAMGNPSSNAKCYSYTPYLLSRWELACLYFEETVIETIHYHCTIEGKFAVQSQVAKLMYCVQEDETLQAYSTV